jgi:hypothetical protein
LLPVSFGPRTASLPTQDPSNNTDIFINDWESDWNTGIKTEAKPDWRLTMMFEMPQYEVRFNDNAQWEEISEINIMQQLSDTYDRVTPAIQQMIEGQHVRTPEAVYRLKGKPKFSEVYV